jgi:hypothetical protein
LVEFWKIKNLKKHLILAVLIKFFLIYIFGYIQNQPKNRTDQNAHSWWPRKLCKFLSQKQIGRKIQRRQKKCMRELFKSRRESKKQRKQNPKIPQLGIHVSTEFAPNCSTTHVV